MNESSYKQFQRRVKNEIKLAHELNEFACVRIEREKTQRKRRKKTVGRTRKKCLENERESKRKTLYLHREPLLVTHKFIAQELIFCIIILNVSLKRAVRIVPFGAVVVIFFVRVTKQEKKKREKDGQQNMKRKMEKLDGAG